MLVFDDEQGRMLDVDPGRAARALRAVARVTGDRFLDDDEAQRLASLALRQAERGKE